MLGVCHHPHQCWTCGLSLRFPVSAWPLWSLDVRAARGTRRHRRFPALRDVVPAKEFRDLAETFEDEEHRRFGQAGFQGVVDKVADIEKSLGIYDLSQFTPT
jgi:hypothetical protein